MGPVLHAVFCGADALCCRGARGIAGCALHGRLYPVLPFMPGELPLPLCPCTAVPCLCSCSLHGRALCGLCEIPLCIVLRVYSIFCISRIAAAPCVLPP